MSNASNFIIENGVLKKYVGPRRGCGDSGGCDEYWQGCV